MDSTIFDKWDSEFNSEELAKDVKNNTSKGDYEDVPDGEYEVKIKKLELVASKKTGEPMVTIWFEVLSEGEYKGRFIFMNQLVSKGFQLKIMDEFLESLDTGVEIDFVDYNQYNNMILDVMEEINTQKLEYALAYGTNEKGFHTYKITDVFENN